VVVAARLLQRWQGFPPKQPQQARQIHLELGHEAPSPQLVKSWE
jgi:hypothetical protein